MELSAWDFRGQEPSGWQLQGVMDYQITGRGIELRIGPEGGGLLHPGVFDHRVEAITVHIQSERPTKGFFIWHEHGTPQDETPQLPFTIEASQTMQTIDLPLTYYKQWTRDADLIGIGFEGNSRVVLERVDARGWSVIEKIEELMIGFWTFDAFRPYSINFLWGPLLSYNPVMRATLYETLPPFAHSATQWMYVLLGIAFGAWLLTHMMRSRRTEAAFGILCALFIGLWVLFDLRMGSELITYARRDIASHVLNEPGAKTLRTHETFYDVLEQSLPLLKAHERFGLVTNENAFYSLVRYNAYPSLPIRPSSDQAGLSLWLVSYRPNVVIDAQGRLTVDEHILSGPGKILRTLPGGNSFLFSTEP
jgi:hypothetical protein